MNIPTTIRRPLALAALTALLAGCSGTGEEKIPVADTSKAQTKESVQKAADQVNAGRGAMKPAGTPKK
jgi:hypothetical protein